MARPNSDDDLLMVTSSAFNISGGRIDGDDESAPTLAVGQAPINQHQFQRLEDSSFFLRGDPRMNMAVKAKLQYPSMLLAMCLKLGGFEYPSDATSATLDNERIKLGQRKNQLNRRVRQARTFVQGTMTTSPANEDNADNDRRHSPHTTSRGTTSHYGAVLAPIAQILGMTGHQHILVKPRLPAKTTEQKECKATTDTKAVKKRLSPQAKQEGDPDWKVCYMDFRSNKMPRLSNPSDLWFSSPTNSRGQNISTSTITHVSSPSQEKSLSRKKTATPGFPGGKEHNRCPAPPTALPAIPVSMLVQTTGDPAVDSAAYKRDENITVDSLHGLLLQDRQCEENEWSKSNASVSSAVVVAKDGSPIASDLKKSISFVSSKLKMTGHGNFTFPRAASSEALSLPSGQPIADATAPANSSKSQDEAAQVLVDPLFSLSQSYFKEWFQEIQVPAPPPPLEGPFAKMKNDIDSSINKGFWIEKQAAKAIETQNTEASTGKTAVSTAVSSPFGVPNEHLLLWNDPTNSGDDNDTDTDYAHHTNVEGRDYMEQVQEQDDQRLELGLQIFQKQLPMLYQQTMMLAGFAPTDYIDERSYIVCRFAQLAWQKEAARLKNLRSINTTAYLVDLGEKQGWKRQQCAAACHTIEKDTDTIQLHQKY